MRGENLSIFWSFVTDWLYWLSPPLMPQSIISHFPLPKAAAVHGVYEIGCLSGYRTQLQTVAGSRGLLSLQNDSYMQQLLFNSGKQGGKEW